jgi:diguanylate cyclase (GGDEF)-like protein
METPNEAVKPLSYPDSKLMDRLVVAQNVSFVLASLTGAVVLCGWLIPSFGSILPEGWSLMKANTSLVILLSVIGLKLTQKKRSNLRLLICRAGAVIVLVIAVSALAGHLGGYEMWSDTLLAPDAEGEIPGRMAAHTAVFFIIMGIFMIPEKGTESVFTHSSLNTLAVLLVAIVLLVTGGYAFDALHLFGHSLYTRTSPHTLICMALLAFVVCMRMADSGFLFVFVGMGIGSRISRMVLPFALIIPFMVTGGIVYSTESLHLLSMPYAAALVTSTTSFMLLGLLMVLARKINRLEGDLLDMSLTDQLTSINNRRGFYLIGEQMFSEGRREDTALSVLFFDVDGLKKVNDTLGHEAGSELLSDFAGLLRANFRKSDVIARVGGDEFAVLGRQAELKSSLKRLDAAAAAVNGTGDKPYDIEYSVGEATTGGVDKYETFDELVARADALMYEQKLAKKALRK